MVRQMDNDDESVWRWHGEVMVTVMVMVATMVVTMVVVVAVGCVGTVTDQTAEREKRIGKKVFTKASVGEVHM